MDELRYALRRLARRPAIALVATATLATSLAAGAVAWSILSATLISPLPITAPERWFVLNVGTPSGGVSHTFAYPHFTAVRDAGVFEHVGAMWVPAMALLANVDGVASRPSVAFVSYDLLRQTGVGVQIGRTFDEDDDRRGAPSTAILTDRYWRDAFAASATVVGRRVRLGRGLVTIVGVAAPGFRGFDLSTTPDLFVPLHTLGDIASPLTNYFAESSHSSSPTSAIRIVVRVSPGSSESEAIARLAGLPLSSKAVKASRFGLTPLAAAAIAGPQRLDVLHFARLLIATIVLLLLAGCATVGLLFVVRADARRAELSTCLAIGASPRRLMCGFASEIAILSIAAGGLALVLESWLFVALRVFELPGGISIERLDLGVDRRAGIATAAVAAAAFLFSTTVTLAFAAKTCLLGSARTVGVSHETTARRRTHGALVSAQVAIALILLSGALLFIRSLEAALSLNPSLAMSDVLASEIALAEHGYTAQSAQGFFNDLRARAEAHARVESASYSSGLGGMGPAGTLLIDGTRRSFPSTVRFVAIDPLHFRTLRVSVTSGRDFSPLDILGAAPVTIVSESFARLLAAGGDAIGRSVTMPHARAGSPPEAVTVVGVVPDVVASVTQLEPLMMYFPMAQRESATYRTLTLRVRDDAGGVGRDVAGMMRSLDASVVPQPFHTLQQRIEQQMAAQRLAAALLGALGGVAFLLTILGAYVLADSAATLRRREMAVRAAIGATAFELCLLLAGQTVRLTGIGLIGGSILLWMASAALGRLLFQVQPTDPAVVTAVAMTIFLVTLLVGLKPAISASRLEIASTLKEE
jgi:predicted permease